MATYKPFAEGVEVSGGAVTAFVEGILLKEKARLILLKNGIENIRPDSWFPLPSWLSAFKEIEETVGVNTLFQIGLKIPETAKFPPDIYDIQKALQSIDVAYHMNHRGGDVGVYEFISAGERGAKIVCRNPYPCDFDRGIITAMARRFSSKGILSKVEHDDTMPCRKNDADSCTYNISW